MAYDIENMLALLLSIKKTSSSTYLASHLSYATIGQLCSEAINAGFIIDKHKKYELTKRGIAFINLTNDELGRKGIDRVISKIPDAIIEKIGIEDIYLPDEF